MQVVEQLRAAGAPLAEWEWSRKPRDSQITKLLAKRSTLAANIYDKLRFRLIVPTPDDLVPMLATLTRQLIPFNYVVPGECVNQLVDLARDPRRRGTARAAHRADDRASRTTSSPAPSTGSSTSSPTCRCASSACCRAPRSPPDLVHVVFVLTEFQIADKAHRDPQRIRRVEPRGVQGAPARARAHAPVPRQGRSVCRRIDAGAGASRFRPSRRDAVVADVERQRGRIDDPRAAEVVLLKYWGNRSRSLGDRTPRTETARVRRAQIPVCSPARPSGHRRDRRPRRAQREVSRGDCRRDAHLASGSWIGRPSGVTANAIAAASRPAVARCRRCARPRRSSSPDPLGGKIVISSTTISKPRRPWNIGGSTDRSLP